MFSSNDPIDEAEVTRYVKAVMEAHGYPKGKAQVEKIADILELTVSSGYRKLDIGSENNSGKWLHTEILKIEQHFGIERHIKKTAGSQEESQGATGRLYVNGVDLECRIWLGNTVIQTAFPYVATHENDVWEVYETASAPKNRQIYEVEKLELVIEKPYVPRIAILDDKKDTADTVRHFLELNGLMAQSFYSVGTLQEQIAKEPFDAYVLDWILQTGTSEECIKLIRERQGNQVPIVLLSGEIESGRASEHDIARAMSELGVLYREKPIRPSIIHTDLKKALQLVN